jgi:hypothetical protein
VLTSRKKYDTMLYARNERAKQSNRAGGRASGNGFNSFQGLARRSHTRLNNLITLCDSCHIKEECRYYRSKNV